MKKRKTKDIWSKQSPPAKNVDAFIKASPRESQARLKQLRVLIKATAPGAKEIISYKMPVYTYRGQSFVGFAGFKKHVGFYPMSGSFLEAYKDELKGYKTSKGAVQFPLDKPMPVALLKRMVKARLKQRRR